MDYMRLCELFSSVVQICCCVIICTELTTARSNNLLDLADDTQLSLSSFDTSVCNVK